MPSMPLDAGDTIELAELLEFLGNWLESDRVTDLSRRYERQHPARRVNR
jgi:hypothetical protein